jgi:hypothetical protein
MPTKEQFTNRLSDAGVEAVLEEFILADGAACVSNDQIDRIRVAIATTYNAQPTDVRIWVVGSAKLGFALCKKRLPDGTNLPRYRPFRPESDIDVAIVCPYIFDQIWYEVSRHAHSWPYLPWNSGSLGDYLVCGWLRPDHFPKHVRLRKCDDWWDCFRKLSSDPFLGRRSVRGGLFYSIEHLKQYQTRALQECLTEEELAT